ncbi:MAG: hydrogenase maturation protease [Chloroflexota bacterium]
MSTKHDAVVSATAPAAGLLAWPVQPEGPDSGTTGALRARPGVGRVLVGGVGYTNLRDRSIGPLLIERFQDRVWPADVVVEDVSYGPIDVLFKLQAEQPGFRLGIFVSAVARGRPPGTVDRYVWQAPTPSVDELQERISEAVTGVVSLENLLLILAHFGALPTRMVVIEVEPEAEESWGPDLSDAARLALDRVEALILEALAASSTAGGDDG